MYSFPSSVPAATRVGDLGNSDVYALMSDTMANTWSLSERQAKNGKEERKGTEGRKKKKGG